MLFHVVSRDHFLRRKKFWRACLWALLAVAIVAVVARNLIVGAAITHIGSFVLGNPVSVRQVQIGFKTVEVGGLKIKETSLADALQLEVRTIRLAPTIWRGLREGVWLRYVVVREPTLHLRFDREGNLLSRFPDSHGGNTGQNLQLPFDRALIADAALVIHQEGKTAFTVGGVSVNTTVDESIHIRAEISDLLGSQLHLESRVDKSTLRGRTQLTLSPMHLDSKRLAQLPLVPNDLADHPVQSTVEAQLQVEHPANDLDFRKHQVDFRATVSDVVSAEYGCLTKGILLRGIQRDGRSSLEVQGPCAKGVLKLNVQLNLAEQKPRFAATFKLAGVEVEPFARMFAPNISVAAIVSAEGMANASWSEEVLTFHAWLAPNLTNIQADEIPVGDLTTKIACNGSFAPRRKQPLAGSLNINTVSEGVDLQDVSRRFAIGRAQGQVGLRGSAVIPLSTLMDLQTYTAGISVHSSVLTCEGMRIYPFTLDAQLENGTVSVQLPQATLASQRAAERPTGCLVERLQLAETLQIQTQLESSVSITRILQPDAWMVAANVAVRDLMIAREPIGDFAATCQLREGNLSLSPCTIFWRDTACSIGGSGELQDKACATVHFTVEPVSMRHVAELASRYSHRPLPVSGTARATGSVNLNLRQLGFAARGDLTLSDAWYGATRIGDAKLSWEADPKAARLRSESADFFGGSYVIDATLQSLDWTRTRLTVSGQNIELRRLAGIVGNQLAVAGVLEGSLRFGSIGDLESLHADGWLATRGASISGAPIQLQTTKLSVEDGLATVAIRGVAFDGSLAMDASSKLAELAAWMQHEPQQFQQLPVFGQIQAKAIAVKRVLAVFDKKRSLTPLKGNVSLACVRDRAAVHKGLLGTVVCSAENLRWNQTQMSRRFRATGVLSPTQLKISNIDGSFADGMLSGGADLQLARVPSGTFRFNAEHVSLRRALAPIRGLSGSVTGTTSFAISGRLGSLTQATAKVQASNITMGDLEIRELRLPIDFSIRSQSSRIQWQCRGGMVNLGGGSVVINSEGGLANGLATMNASMNMRRVDSSKLMRGKSLSAGIIDGYVKVQAKRARGAEDLTGRFHLELSQIQSLELPGSESLLQLVKLPTLSGPTVKDRDGGTIDGRLAGGLLRVDRLALSKSGLLLLMDGTSTLDGRLDFDVTAFTNQSGPADGLLALADSPVMLAVSAPVAVVAKANEAIKDRVIHVHVGGTGARPTLRLQPAKNLSQDALRFLIASTLGSPVANMATRQQKQPVR